MLHARLWTRGARVAGPDAVIVRDGRIAALDSSAAARAAAGPHTRVIDARGGTVTPGLADAHLHLLDWARARAEVDLAGARSADEAAARVADAARGTSGAVVGRGWDANGWEGLPHRQALDAVVADRPVLLYSRDFHNLWVNGAALAAAGVTAATADPPGGVIARDATGAPTGLLQEHAMRLCAPLAASDPAADAPRLRAAIDELLARGVTAVHDFEGTDAHRLLRAASRDPRRVRVLMHLPHGQLDAAIALGWSSGLGDDDFRIGAVKLFADGTLGSRTAAMLEPYDGTTERGLDLLPPETLAAEVRRAVEHGWSVAVHAIGDRAARATLDAFSAVAGRLPGLALAPRIEHAQLVHPDDQPRFAALGVAASMQPAHCTSDVPLAERWWGSRRDHAYPWRSLLERGARLAFGSDAPVEPPDPAEGLRSATTRRPRGAAPWTPGQRIGIDAALTAYTEGAARLAGAWPRLGSLDPGAHADLVVWDADLHGIGEEALGGARPLATVLAGSIVYAHPGLEVPPASARAPGSARDEGNG